MRTIHLRAWLAASALLCGGTLARAAVQSAEDLTGCLLPNGRAVLPALGGPLAANGSVLKFSTGAFSTLPATDDDKKVLTPDQSAARIQSTNLGDLQYLVDAKGNGSLWAFSGAITDVPRALYLAEVTGKTIEEPGPIPKTSRNFAGQISIQDGTLYLVKTTDGRFALLRILEQTKDALVIQFVYQPSGTTTFEIPPHPRVPYVRPTDAQPATAPAVAAATAAATEPVIPHGSSIASLSPIPTGPVDTAFSGTGAGAAAPDITPLPPVTKTVLPPVPPTPMAPGDVNDPRERVIRIVGTPAASALTTIPPRPTAGNPSPTVSAPFPITGTPIVDPALEGFVQQRTQMIQRRLDLVALPAKSGQEIERKAQAILELGYLHADDPAVAEALVSEIAFVNTRTPVKEFSPDALYPALAALKRLGKPATTAALRGLHRLDLESPGTDLDAPVYKVKLLANVIRSVEGDDVADFIFRRESAAETDPKRKAVFEYLLNN